MIGIINCGMGNIKAFTSFFNAEKISYKIVKEVSDFDGVTKIILPGVGSFDYAMRKIKEIKIIDILNRLVLFQKVPILGICVGMQIMFDSSEEGEMKGLSWLKGKIHKLNDKVNMPLPHMGWNSLEIKMNDPLFMGLASNTRLYYLHSFCLDANNTNSSVLAESEYTTTFPAVIRSGNIYGIQGHPERSHSTGRVILNNFCKLS